MGISPNMIDQNLAMFPVLNENNYALPDIPKIKIIFEVHTSRSFFISHLLI